MNPGSLNVNIELILICCADWYWFVVLTDIDLLCWRSDMLRVYNDTVQLDRLQLPEFMAVGPPKHKQQVCFNFK